jgi:hypothetical protein
MKLWAFVVIARSLNGWKVASMFVLSNVLHSSGVGERSETQVDSAA